jgi:hypothetical protein
MSTSQRISRGLSLLKAFPALFLLCSLLAVLVGTQQTSSDEAKARLSQLMWSAFMCSTYAENAEKKEEQNRLFDAGYKAGQSFMAAVEGGQVSKDDFSKHVPVYVGLLLQGPSTEFVLGRIFEFASGQANDQIVKRDASGATLETKDRIRDKLLRKMKAERLYDQRNCRVIQ